MCGRFSLTSPAAVLAGHFDVDLPEDFAPRFNIAPSQNVLAVRGGEDPHPERHAAMLRWGLVPSWAEDESIGNRLINARSETAASKPAYRAAARRRRCLVPADGFYEWSSKESGGRQPYRIVLESDGPFAFAGLWEGREDGQGGLLESCTILTAPAAGPAATLHHRMPVIVSPADYDSWLAPGKSAEQDIERAVERRQTRLRFYRVSRRVNSPRNDDPLCVEPAPGQESLPLDP